MMIRLNARALPGLVCHLRPRSAFAAGLLISDDQGEVGTAFCKPFVGSDIGGGQGRSVKALCPDEGQIEVVREHSCESIVYMSDSQLLTENELKKHHEHEPAHGGNSAAEAFSLLMSGFQGSFRSSPVGA